MKLLLLVCAVIALVCCPINTAQAQSSPEPDECQHVLQKVEATEPDEGNPGNIEYYVCTICHKLFADEDARFEISQDQILPIKPEIIDYTALEWTVQSDTPITFTTNISVAYFSSVSIDGNKLPLDDFELDEESSNIKVTVKPRAFAQLNEGNHRLFIDTTRGTAQIDFMVVPVAEQPAEPIQSDVLDFGQIILIISVSMLAVICVVLAVMYFMTKRKADENK